MAKRSSKTKNTRGSRRSVRVRSLQVRYPDYRPCHPGEAEAALGPDRAGWLADLYGGELRAADVALELVLRSGELTVDDHDADNPGPQRYTLDHYRALLQAEREQDPLADETGTRWDKEEEAIEALHDYHQMGAFFLTREHVLEWARDDRTRAEPAPDLGNPKVRAAGEAVLRFHASLDAYSASLAASPHTPKQEDPAAVAEMEAAEEALGAVVRSQLNGNQRLAFAAAAALRAERVQAAP